MREVRFAQTFSYTIFLYPFINIITAGLSLSPQHESITSADPQALPETSLVENHWPRTELSSSMTPLHQTLRDVACELKKAGAYIFLQNTQDSSPMNCGRVIPNDKAQDGASPENATCALR